MIQTSDSKQRFESQTGQKETSGLYAAKIGHLVKKFGDNTAIKDVSFNIQSGKIIGLVGPDGAGKTTLIRLLLGLLLPTSGSISILGLNPSVDMDKIHQEIGYMPQKFGLYEDLSVQENLNLHADLKGLKPDEKQAAFKTLLEFTGLAKFTGRLAGQLSGGMKQKLGLACALLGHPKFLLLDEPGVGVDPISRRELMKMVRGLIKDGKTVLWSTSYLDEAEGFDDVIVLNDGQVIYHGKPSDLTKEVNGHVFLTKGHGVNNRRLLRQILKSNEPVVDAVIQGDQVRLVICDEKTCKKHAKYLQPVKPRFEDAVIYKLGGIVQEPSQVAKEIEVDETMPIVIEADHLTKKYGTFAAAKDITFQIRRGEIFGLLGPNGAGKSTSFKMMCGLSRPTHGHAYITGIDMRQSPIEARSKLGYMAQKFSLFSPLTVRQNLEFFAGIYGLKGPQKQVKIEQMVKIFNLRGYLKSKAGDLPLGYKQRLALSCAIMHNPPILFLDEPTSGVDPLTRREFWNHINSMVEKGVTVMVTTHFMDEAEYCDRIALIYQGHAIKTGTPSELKKPGETMEDAFIRTIEEYDAAHPNEERT